ncbi:hypothetical protein Tco_0613717 [Tanacetum coccineum]
MLRRVKGIVLVCLGLNSAKNAISEDSQSRPYLSELVAFVHLILEKDTVLVKGFNKVEFVFWLRKSSGEIAHILDSGVAGLALAGIGFKKLVVDTLEIEVKDGCCWTQMHQTPWSSVELGIIFRWRFRLTDAAESDRLFFLLLGPATSLSIGVFIAIKDSHESMDQILQRSTLSVDRMNSGPGNIEYFSIKSAVCRSRILRRASSSFVPRLIYNSRRNLGFIEPMHQLFFTSDISCSNFAYFSCKGDEWSDFRKRCGDCCSFSCELVESDSSDGSEM